MLTNAVVVAFLLTFAYSQTIAFGLLAVSTVAILLRHSRHKRLPYFNAKDALFAAYGIAALVPVAYDPSQATAWLLAVAYPWLLTFVFQNLRVRAPHLFAFGVCLFVVSVALAGEMLLQVAPGQWDISLARLATVNRNLGFYFRGDERLGPNTAAYMSAAAVILALAMIRFWRGHPLLKIGAVSVPFVFLVVSGGRNAWIGTAACVGLFALYRPEASKRGRLVGRTLIVLAIVSGFAMAYSTIGSAQGSLLAERLELLLSPGEDSSVSLRLTYWLAALQMIQERPEGWGFAAHLALHGRSAHNELLGQLVGAGWVGTTFFVALLAWVWWSVFRLPRHTPGADAMRFTALSFLILATLAMVTEQLSVSLGNTFWPMFWVIIGATFGVERTTRERRSAIGRDLPPRRRDRTSIGRGSGMILRGASSEVGRQPDTKLN